MVELAIVEGSDMTRDRLEVADADFSAAMDSRSYGMHAIGSNGGWCAKRGAGNVAKWLSDGENMRKKAKMISRRNRIKGIRFQRRYIRLL